MIGSNDALEFSKRPTESGELGRWPDFIGIGTIKSGTTWLWQCLREHPELYLPRMKELEYFNSQYERGVEWYKSFFADAGARLCGEVSPQYVHDPDAARRMAQLSGRLKLISCFRNPVDRAYSHFMMDARAHAGLSDRDKARMFDELVRAGDSKYVRFGFYAAQISPFVEIFGRQAIHAVFFDDIRDKPHDVLRDICIFLGVASDFVPNSLMGSVNSSKRYRSVWLFNTLRGTVRLADRIGLGELIMFLKRIAIRDRVLELLEVPDQYHPMSRDTRRRLAATYADSNRRLGEIFDRDLSTWQKA
jgi:hypothetical protein